MAEGRGLRLAAHDEDDLKALSAALQDAVLKGSDLTFDPRRRSFTAVVNRFCWETTDRNERVRAAVRFEGVLSAQARGIPQDRTDVVVSLLAINFVLDPEPPGGTLSLLFAGDADMRLRVECVDASLVDLSEPWRVRSRPRHDLRDDAS